MSNKAQIAELLGIDPQAASMAPARITRHVFFDTMATKHGIAPATEDEALRLWEASEALESKQAALRQAANPINKGLNILLGSQKQASAANNTQVDEQKYYDARNNLVESKTAAYLADPLVYGTLLTAFTE